MKLIYAGKSDKGKLRKTNEDFYACQKINDDEYLFVVADGMGGHQAGDVASKLGTLTFIRQYISLRESKIPIQEALRESIAGANDKILEKATEDLQKRGMGTTFSAAVLSDMTAHIVHVGDSRIYIARGNEMARLTTDHTFVEKMVEEGRLTEQEARDHPQKNILYMSLGARQSFTPEISESFGLKDNDMLVLCSDGLNNMVTDEEIKKYINDYNPSKAVDKLVKLANENGGIDNITLLVIHVDAQGTKTSEKTEPIKILKKKKKLRSFFSILFPEEK
jgi:protein phosphatase